MLPVFLEPDELAAAIMAQLEHLKRLDGALVEWLPPVSIRVVDTEGASAIVVPDMSGLAYRRWAEFQAFLGMVPQSFATSWTLRPRVLEIVDENANAIDARMAAGPTTIVKLSSREPARRTTPYWPPAKSRVAWT